LIKVRLGVVSEIEIKKGIYNDIGTPSTYLAEPIL
jgi:hypothetical protein